MAGGASSCQDPQPRSPALPLCPLPTFIELPCAPLITTLLTSLPGRDLVSTARAPRWAPCVFSGQGADVPGSTHRQSPRSLLSLTSLLVLAWGQGEADAGGWQECGMAHQWAARGQERAQQEQIDVLNYLAREHEAAAAQHPTQGHGATLASRHGTPPHHLAQTGRPGTHCQAAGRLHPPRVPCHPFGWWMMRHRAHQSPPGSPHAPPTAPNCGACTQVVPSVPTLSPAGHPTPSTTALPGQRHGAADSCTLQGDCTLQRVPCAHCGPRRVTASPSKL